MKRSHSRTLLQTSLASAAALVFTLQFVQGPAIAATAAGTAITNTASATYSDGNGNNYTTNSNTVTTTVQNVPALTVTANDTGNPAQTVGTGQLVSDPFTLTNTGNSSGNFNVTADATPSNGTLVGYVLNSATTGTCSVAAPCTLANLNTALGALAPTAPGGTVAVNVIYTATQSAGSTTTQTLTADIASTVGGTTTTSATTSASETDAVNAQPRLDLSKTIGAFTGTNPIPFTITANNGGGFAARDLTSAEALLNATTANTVTTPGVLITDKIPVDSTTNLPLVITTGSPTVVLAGASANTTATLFYTTAANGTSGWTKTFVAGTAYTYIAAYLTGGTGGVELPSDPNGSPNGGGVTVNGGTTTANVTTAQVTLKFSIAQPAQNANAISNIANSAIGGNVNENGTEPVIAPGFGAPGTGTAVNDSATQSLQTPLNNTTPSVGTTPPGGASNTVTTSSIVSTVVNGPLGNANVAVTGLYPGAPTGQTATYNNDFTAVSAVCSQAAPVAPASVGPAVAAQNCTVPATIVLPGTFENTGNTADNFGASVTALAGYTAQVYLATCTTGNTAANTNTNLTGVNCTRGAALTNASAVGGTVASTTAQLVNVGNGAYQTYEVVYTAAAGTVEPAFAALDSPVTISGLNGTGTGLDANMTHFDVYPGGPIELTKTQATKCPPATAYGTATNAGVTAAPGCSIQYVISYQNVAPAASYAGGAQAGTEPAFATAGIDVPANSNFVLTEDGGTATGAGANGASWYEFSNGLLAAPTTTGTPTFTFAYFTGGGTTSTATFPTTTPSNVSKFTATSTSGVAPGTAGTVTFQVTIK